MIEDQHFGNECGQGTTIGKYEHGVGVILNVAECFTGFIPISERIILLAQANMKIIQVYAPTFQHSVEEVKEFYSTIS